MANGPGIDYGGGTTNIDKETGIRYGVVSSHSLSGDALAMLESDYGDPTCPHCGNPVIDSGDAPDEEWNDGKDYACVPCQRVYWSDEVFGDEPTGHHYSGEGYVLVDCLDTDLMVLKSPYFTYAEFCSPCVPGAGNLDSYNPSGVKTYCLGDDWFEDGKAPYPTYDVVTGEPTG